MDYVVTQASGAVLASSGDGLDMLLATACRADSGYEDAGAFVPLQVQFMERHSAAGLIPGEQQQTLFSSSSSSCLSNTATYLVQRIDQ